MATTQQLLEHPKERLDHPPRAIDLADEFSGKIKAVGRDSKEAVAVRYVFAVFETCVRDLCSRKSSESQSFGCQVAKTPPFTSSGRIEVGLLLGLLQAGERLSMPHSGPLQTIGPKCAELRVRDAEHHWRIIYRLDDDAVIVIDVFPKIEVGAPDVSLDQLVRAFTAAGGRIQCQPPQPSITTKSSRLRVALSKNWPAIATKPKHDNLRLDGEGNCVVEFTLDSDGSHLNLTRAPSRRTD